MVNPPSTLRVVRILHAAMLGGLVATGGTLVLVRRLVPLPAMGTAASSRPVLTTAAGLLLTVAWLALRSRVPARRSEQSADAYWGVPSTRVGAIVLWAAVEGAGVIAAVGFFLTGAAADRRGLAPRARHAGAVGAGSPARGRRVLSITKASSHLQAANVTTLIPRVSLSLPHEESPLPKRNYGFEKRQKEIKRQQKKEEKKQKKLDRAKEAGEPTPDPNALPANGDQAVTP